MKKIIKKKLRVIYVIMSRIFLPLFYDKKYLKGRHFESGSTYGWNFTWRDLFMQKIIGYNRWIPWPVSHRNSVDNFKNIFFDTDDLNNFQNYGCYFQCNYGAKIVLGKGTWIAPNVGLITANHDIKDLDNHAIAKDIVLGEKCWIGMNSVILPGVNLGNNTIVGAGSIVTKSFPEGNCIIAGNPARLLKKLE